MTKHFLAISLFSITIFTSLSGGVHICNPSESAVIASEGKPLYSIIIPHGASQEIRKYARDMKRILGCIIGNEFEIKEGRGGNGIIIGTVKDLPGIPFRPAFDLNDTGEIQGYEIKTHENGIYIIGATDKASGYAVYDFLYRLGYRKFFPSDNWEIIPETKHLSLAVHIRETPDYYTRRIWPGYGLWPEYNEASDLWNVINRNGGYMLNTSHAYETIIRENKKIFDEHPEYYGLFNGKRSSSKLCISNMGLRKLVADYAVNRFEKNPDLESFSVDPSDGGGWCECEECIKLGTPSTRAVLLANTTASAVREKFQNKRVGLYAYNEHSPAPDIDVDKDVVVSIATSFIRGGLTLDETIEAWRSKKAVIGIREYYDVCIWSYNIPGKSRASNVRYLHNSIPKFYNIGARYMSAESSDDWGSSGLGYYIAEKLLWNTKETENIDSIINDFLSRSFGPADMEMKNFYTLLDGSAPKPLSSDMIGRMYRILEKALMKVSDKYDIVKRINDLVIYTRYCELYLAFRQANGEQAQKISEQITAFAASIKDTRMIHSKGFYREYKRFLNAKQNDPGEAWKKTNTFKQENINQIIIDGIASHKLLDFETVSFSDQLRPVNRFAEEDIKDLQLHPGRGTVTYYTWADEKLQPWEFTVTGGLIKHYRNRGNVKIELWKIGGASATGDLETLIQSDTSVPPDGIAYTIKFTPAQPGLHKIIINDGSDMTRFEWKNGTYMTINADSVSTPSLSGNFYFYIPKGTKTLGFFCEMNRGQIIAPDGKSILKFNKTIGYQSFQIQDGMDGKIWHLQNVSGRLGLMTVPPYIAAEPAALLLPEEIVIKDKL